MKVASETATDTADKVAELEDNRPNPYDDSGLKQHIKETTAGLETRKFDREEAYGLQRELSTEIEMMKETIQKYDGVLNALGDADTVDQEALDTLAAAMKAKMMARTVLL